MTEGFLFAPSSCYPTPVAYLVDRAGTPLHRWSNPIHQPSPADDPPNFLRGWNHVEVDRAGNLFAVVPSRSLLKLTPDSRLAWSCDVAAHHDIALDADGYAHVLTEAPRRVTLDGRSLVVQDNMVAVVAPDGTLLRETSLYDVLRTDAGLREVIDASTRRRAEDFRRRGWPVPGDDVPAAVAAETGAILATGRYEGERRRALRRLRELPGRPCDVLHTNTLELLAEHPDGRWDRGDVLVGMRDLDTIAVLDLARGAVRWWWGPGTLSGPHQPSMLPDGRVLVFDNGAAVGRSRVLVVDPATGQLAWSWSADPPESFFCPIAGGCERLPSGNILVTKANATGGGAFELAADGRVVWDLTLPVDVYGADRGRVSIYRMSAVDPATVAHLAGRT